MELVENIRWRRGQSIDEIEQITCGFHLNGKNLIRIYFTSFTLNSRINRFRNKLI